MPEIGMRAEHCQCVAACIKGVEPMGDCICKLPGETVTAYCDVCDPTHQRFTWHNNGSCVACVRKARQEAKERMARRHEEVLAAPPQPVNLDEIEPPRFGNPPIPTPSPIRFGTPIEVPSQSIAVSLQVVLRVNGHDIPLATDLMDVIELIRHAPRH